MGVLSLAPSKPALEAVALDGPSQGPVFGFWGCCVLEAPEVVSCAQHPIWAFMPDFILFISKNLARNLDHHLQEGNMPSHTNWQVLGVGGGAPESHLFPGDPALQTCGNEDGGFPQDTGLISA